MSMEFAVSEAEEQIRKGLIQGCVIGTIHHAPIALGKQTINPAETQMTLDSRFDMASVGKVFTATCCSILAERGEIDIDAPFTKYLPEHKLGNACRITLRDLATHSSGFSNEKPYEVPDPKLFFEKLWDKMPAYPLHDRFEYCCYNMILLGLILNKVTGKDLDTLARELIWAPLGMTHTTWNEPGPGPHEVEHWFPNRPAGSHNDTSCFYAKRPIGNGSCFSTCGDMLLFANELIERKHFAPKVYDLMETCTYEKDGARRSFGWDMCDLRRPASFSKKAIFHSGFTGQTIAVDPGTGHAAVILTSRTGDWELANQGRVKMIDLFYQN